MAQSEKLGDSSRVDEVLGSHLRRHGNSLGDLTTELPMGSLGGKTIQRDGPGGALTPRGLAETYVGGPDMENPMAFVPGRANMDRPGANVTPSELLGVVLHGLKEAGLADQSMPRVAETVARFTAYLERGHGIQSVHDIGTGHVAGFVFAPLPAPSGRGRPAIATMHLRRTALRLYFRIARQEGVIQADPTVDLHLPARSRVAVRPLTSDEITLCRSFSLKSLTATRHPAAFALAEATARTAEIPHIRVSDLDLERGRVWVHGSPKTEARWGYPSQWGLLQFARRVEAVKGGSEPDPRLVYRGTGSEESRQAASCISTPRPSSVPVSPVSPTFALFRLWRGRVAASSPKPAA